jgi:hypothetical protein
MAARHGTRRGYSEGCRCDDCRDAQRLYQQRYRERPRSLSSVTNVTPAASSPGPAKAAVETEVAGLADARTGLAQVALAMARVLDNPRAVSSRLAAARVLGGLLDKLRSASAGGRRGRLALVRTMSDQGGV